MARGKCKKCGVEFLDTDQIVDSTKAEHRKAYGHELEIA